MNREQVFTEILEKLFNHTQRKHDIHYEEGQGALVVPENYPLERPYVLIAFNEMQLHMMALTGVNINFK